MLEEISMPFLLITRKSYLESHNSGDTLNKLKTFAKEN